MAIRRCYRLVSVKEDDTLTTEQQDWLYDIDEDYHTKKDWNKNAKEKTAKFNARFGTEFAVEELFGSVDDWNGYYYCTVCGDSFWDYEDHECY